MKGSQRFRSVQPALLIPLLVVLAVLSAPAVAHARPSAAPARPADACASAGVDAPVHPPTARPRPPGWGWCGDGDWCWDWDWG
ncbi:hypothetical protein, partial [Streptomyces sp. WAC 06725]|uniref:hypothetical protein n=1 Tax=Streptomyces sp. WAC 06725 TaxID=2203209 RepID=UPI001C8B41EA